MNKLIRDKIPDILKKKGVMPSFSELNNSDFFDSLLEKLYEESLELQDSNDDTFAEELADVLEVVLSLAKHKNMSPQDLDQIRVQKIINAGGFDKRLFFTDPRPVKKWIAISGSWRYMFDEIEADVRKVVSEKLRSENGIVTGGALGVDFIATDEVIRRKSLNRLRIYLPTTLEKYSQHYFQRASEGVITSDQAEQLTNQLLFVKDTSPESFVELSDKEVVDKAQYYERNSKVIDACDELVAFQVNESQGTADAIAKAKDAGKKTIVYSYKIY